jgi:hypothetical protein
MCDIAQTVSHRCHIIARTADALSREKIARASTQDAITRRNEMSLGTILLVIVALMLIGVIPGWPHSRSWGYGPSGGIGLVLIILIILLLTGRF